MSKTKAKIVKRLRRFVEVLEVDIEGLFNTWECRACQTTICRVTALLELTPQYCTCYSDLNPEWEIQGNQPDLVDVEPEGNGDE